MPHIIQDGVASEAEEVEPRRAARRRDSPAAKRAVPECGRVRTMGEQAMRLAVSFLLNSGAERKLKVYNRRRERPIPHESALRSRSFSLVAIW